MVSPRYSKDLGSVRRLFYIMNDVYTYRWLAPIHNLNTRDSSLRTALGRNYSQDEDDDGFHFKSHKQTL